MKRLHDLLEQFASPRILDIATGSGQFIQILISVTNHYSEIIGLDTHIKAIERAKEQIQFENVSFVAGDIFNVQDLGLFDIITLSNSLHHFGDVDGLFNQMKSLLKPSGIIIINEMINDHQNEAQMTHVMMHHFWAEIDRINGVCHNETFSSDYLMTYFKQSDLKLLDNWTLTYDEPQVLRPEDYTWLKGTLNQSVERVEISEHPKLLSEKERLLKRLDLVGFESATQLIFILKKS